MLPRSGIAYLPTVPSSLEPLILFVNRCLFACVLRESYTMFAGVFMPTIQVGSVSDFLVPLRQPLPL